MIKIFLKVCHLILATSIICDFTYSLTMSNTKFKKRVIKKYIHVNFKFFSMYGKNHEADLNKIKCFKFDIAITCFILV